MTFNSKPSYSFSVSGKDKESSAQPPRPDFENNLAEFREEFFRYVADTDLTFDLDLLRKNPNPPVEIPAPEHPDDLMHPTTKEELDMPLRLTGPKVINGDILAEIVMLESEVRVKGSVYGRSEVTIGSSCVVEGSVVSGGELQIDKGSRIEGAAIGSEVQINGPVQIEGPVYSRGSLNTEGKVEAQLLFASDAIHLKGNPEEDEVRVEAGLIMAKTGELLAEVPVYLANVKVQPERQKFFLSRNDTSEFRLIRATAAAAEAAKGQASLLTTLTDTELEKLIAEIGNLES
ncbi:MAG TPA: polymer-forming cytoskeletal protein [Chloroflexia bacterium]|nr:polymer-forming cytoskeletal protein [Chloroflexia bacterium]